MLVEHKLPTICDKTRMIILLQFSLKARQSFTSRVYNNNT